MTAFSVLLSVYDKENPQFLYLSLNSIWTQQTLKPNEIIIVKDGPLTTDLDDIINRFVAIAPIKTIELNKNTGLGNALRIGLEKCSFEFVARMDSDDIAVPTRFEKQINFFRSHPDIDFISSNIAEFVDDPNNINGLRNVPLLSKDIITFAKRRNPMNHMAIMFKKSIVIDAGNYKRFHGYEDYYLWVRMLQRGYKASNLEEVLVYARIGNNMIARRQGLIFFQKELQLQKEFLSMKFITKYEYISNILLRAIPRLMPMSALKLIYKTLRK